MATVKRRSTVPYYAAAGTWVIYALLFPLYRVPQFIFIAIVSAVVYFIIKFPRGPGGGPGSHPPHKGGRTPHPPPRPKSKGRQTFPPSAKRGYTTHNKVKRIARHHPRQ